MDGWVVCSCPVPSQAKETRAACTRPAPAVHTRVCVLWWKGGRVMSPPPGVGHSSSIVQSTARRVLAGALAEGDMYVSWSCRRSVDLEG